MKFLGDVEAQRIGPLADALRGACRAFPALDLRAERIGFFPDQRSPRVVWAGISDRRNQLPLLQGAIEAASRDFTAEVADKSFTGHVTLGRLKGLSHAEAEALAGLVSGLAARFFGVWTAGQVELIRSQLSPHGTQYMTLATIPPACPVNSGARKSNLLCSGPGASCHLRDK